MSDNDELATIPDPDADVLEKQPEHADEEPTGPPEPITPQTAPAAAQDRVLYENEINAGALQFAEDAKAIYIEARLAGCDVRIVVTDEDGVEVDKDDSDEAPLAEGTALVAALEAGVTPYSDWNKDELKDEAKERGLSVSGSKDELIERLEADDAHDAEEITDPEEE